MWVLADANLIVPNYKAALLQTVGERAFEEISCQSDCHRQTARCLKQLRNPL
jgi:hypothetical protein